jgi:hypothetical protein
MIVNVDGWLDELPDEARFIEFRSNKDSGSAGHMAVYNVHGENISDRCVSLGLPADVHWTKRIPEKKETK